MMTKNLKNNKNKIGMFLIMGKRERKWLILEEEEETDKKMNDITIMWLIVSMMFGLALADLLNMTIIFYSSIVFGLLLMFRMKKTPSDTLGWEKSSVQSIIVWSLVILTLIIMMINYYI